ncbi:unnamed protein product [Brachionus calyciflorus]|uniref:Uncharacterized protein n=1 Tax=Brachionus calyciflorus TaxID=104777 RepID=A0A814E6D7_9BILA|nr:unnamed protein product [Brachionus calyciflorus]
MSGNEDTETEIESNQAEFDQAILSALANVQNCSKRKKNGLKATEPNNWMIWLSEQANNCKLECWLPKEHKILLNSIPESIDSKLTPLIGSGHIETVQKPNTTVDIPNNDFMNMFMQWSLQIKNFSL